MRTEASKPFSDQLEKWLKEGRNKTLAGLDEVFQDKSFAITFMVLMAFPALPIPTGGLSHVFEVIVMLMCLQMVAGRQTPWLPRKWKNMHLGKVLTNKVIPTLMRWIRWFEKHSNPRGGSVLNLSLVQRLLGLIIFCLALAAFLAPPFSYLDTLPSLGVVIISLAIILDDLILAIAGVFIGMTGIALAIALGAAIVESSRHFF